MSINTINGTLSLLGRIADIRQAVKPIYHYTSDKPAFRRTEIVQPFERVSPESQGVSSALIADFLEALSAEEELNMHSVLILRNGKLLAEAAWADETAKVWKSTFSAAKSVTSLAVGMLIDEGKLKLTDKLTELFGDRIPPLTRLAVNNLTVRHLLTMSTGASFNEAECMSERDWVKGYFTGTFSPDAFAYNSLNTYMLAVIVKEKTGLGLVDYLRPRLFEPLGIGNVCWETSPTGVEKGGWGLYIYPEDMAKIGQLVMNDGLWNGKRLISREWLDLAAHRQIGTGAVSERFDYGFQIWTGRQLDSFLFNGMFGQNVYGIRTNGVLLVSNAGNSELFQDSSYFRVAEQFFARPFAPSLPEIPEDRERLDKVIYALAEHPPKPEAPKPKPAAAPAPAVTNPPVAPAKKSFWSFLRREPQQTAAPAAPAVPEAPPAPKKPALPPECETLNGVRLTADDEIAPSLGFLPVIWQAVTNNYAGGLEAIEFRRVADKFFMTYVETSASYTAEIGFNYPADTTLVFGGVPYLVRIRGAFARNEDDEPVLKLRVTFPETPVRRYFKVFYGKKPRLIQTEEPGNDFVFEQIVHIKDEITERPLGGTLNLVDDDFLRYRISRKFAPVAALKAQEPQEK